MSAAEPGRLGNQNCPRCGRKLLGGFCAYCDANLDLQGKKTSKRGSDPDLKKSDRAFWGVVAAGAILVVLIIIAPKHGGTDSATTPSAPSGYSIDKTTALIMAQDFVRDRLVSPATARFVYVPTDSAVTYLGDQRYQVMGELDSQNRFGALIRSSYTCVVRDTRTGTRTLESCNIRER